MSCEPVATPSAKSKLFLWFILDLEALKHNEEFNKKMK